MENKIEITNNMYRFEEMVDSMKQSIDNIDKVINEQTDLIEMIESHDADKKFEEMCTKLREQLDTYKNQQDTLKHRCELLGYVVNTCKENEELTKLICTFATALGMFENE